jgi:hypothetical protein
MSTVNRVDELLNILVKSDIKAANITANINPLRPVGIKFIINIGYAAFEQPFLESHTFKQISGSVQPFFK